MWVFFGGAEQLRPNDPDVSMRRGLGCRNASYLCYLLAVLLSSGTASTFAVPFELHGQAREVNLIEYKLSLLISNVTPVDISHAQQIAFMVHISHDPMASAV